jgi:hypothetical protein
MSVSSWKTYHSGFVLRVTKSLETGESKPPHCVKGIAPDIPMALLSNTRVPDGKARKAR